MENQSDKIITHEMTAEEMDKFNKEDNILEAYRSFFKQDMTEVLRRELETTKEMRDKVDLLYFDNIPLKLWGKIYLLAPRAGFAAFILVCIVITYLFFSK